MQGGNGSVPSPAARAARNLSSRLTGLVDRGYLGWLLLALGAAVAAAYLYVRPLQGSPLVLNGIELCGLLGLIAGVRRHRPEAARAWWLFALGLALFLAGDIYTESVRVLLRVAVPTPSLGDAARLAAYPLVTAGIVLLVRRRSQRADDPGVVDGLIIALGLALASAILLIAPYVHNQRLGPLPRLVSIGYPSGDLMLLAAIIGMAFDVGKRRPSFYLLIAAIVSLLVGDDVTGLLRLHHGYHHQLWLHAGRIFFFLFWGAAALHPSVRELSDAEVTRQSRFTTLRLVFLTGATLIAPVLEIAEVLPLHNADLLFIIVASIALFSLAVARMAGLVREREESVAREHALSAAGGLLIGVTEPMDILAAALRAVAELDGRPLPALRGPGTGARARQPGSADRMADLPEPALAVSQLGCRGRRGATALGALAADAAHDTRAAARARSPARGRRPGVALPGARR